MGPIFLLPPRPHRPRKPGCLEPAPRFQATTHVLTPSVSSIDGATVQTLKTFPDHRGDVGRRCRGLEALKIHECKIEVSS